MKKKIAAIVLATTAGIIVNNTEIVKAVELSEKTQSNHEATDLQQVKAVQKGKVINVTSNLRIRAEASTQSKILGSLMPSTVVDVESKSGSWYKIKHNGISGYVHADYLKIISSSNDGGSNNNQNNGDSNNNQNSNLKKGQVVNVTSKLRIRSNANTNSSVVGYLNPNEKFSIIEKQGSWYKISKNNINGYVHGDYVKIISDETSKPPITETPPPVTEDNLVVESGRGQVINVTSNLRVRKTPNTSADVVGYLGPKDTFDINGKSGVWYYITFNGKKGYVHGDYVKKINSSNEESKPESGQEVSSKYEKVFSIMKSQIGTPYLYGGSGEEITTSSLASLKSRFPDKASRGDYNIDSKFINSGYRAFDCSGFMYWGFKQVGVNLGRSTYDQVKNGVEVNPNNAKPGDLLFYKDLGHVGMYIGNGQWIESPKPGEYVRISNVPWSLIGRARRVL